MSTQFIEQVVELTNIERAKAGLQPLELNNQLLNAAQDHSNDMAQDDFFSHTGADGSSIGDRVRASGYQYSTTGENIAAGQTTPAQVVEGWMNSPGHRANILNPNYTEIGVGYEYLQNDTGSVNYNHYWTQVFGTPLNNNAGSRSTQTPKPTPSQPEPVEIEVEAVEEVSKPTPTPTQPEPVEIEVEAVDKVSNPKTEEISEPLIENTTDNGQSKSIDDVNNNNDVFNSNNSAPSEISYSYLVFFNGYSDSLTGKTNNLTLSGDSATDSLNNFGKLRSASRYIKQYQDDFSQLLKDSSLGSAMDIQENSDFVDLVEDISNSDLTQRQKNLAFKMLDLFI